MITSARSEWEYATTRVFPSTLRFLAWTFTWLMMMTLTLGSSMALIYMSAGGFSTAWGAIVWMVMAVLVAAFGTLAFLCNAQFRLAVIFFFASFISDYCLVLSFFGLVQLTPFLLMPPIVAVNAAYFYLAVRHLAPKPLPPRQDMRALPSQNRLALSKCRRTDGGPT